MHCNLELCPSLYIHFFACSASHNPVRVVVWSPTHKFRRAQFGGHVSQFVARFNQRAFIPRLNVYHRVCIAIEGILSQPVQIAKQMNPRSCCDLRAYDLIGMTQFWHVFLCPALPRDPDYVNASKNEVHHLDARRGQKTIRIFGFGDYLSFSTIVPFCHLSPHRVAAEFGQTPFSGVKPDTLPIQSYAFAPPELFYITILVLGSSNSAWITASFGFQFQELINVIHEKSPFACFGVVLGQLILVYLTDIEYPISFLYSQPNFIH